MSPPPLVPGVDGSQVPDGLQLIRMANEPNISHLNPEAARCVTAGKALPMFFDLSSEDKKQLIPRLSVWVEGLTTVAQAWILVGASRTRRWVVWLRTEKVRLIFAPSVDGFMSTPPLEIHWERATQLIETGEHVLETRPGWEGHAGIVHLDKGNKTQRQTLRMQLAESAVVQILTLEQLEAFEQQ